MFSLSLTLICDNFITISSYFHNKVRIDRKNRLFCLPNLAAGQTNSSHGSNEGTPSAGISKVGVSTGGMV